MVTKIVVLRRKTPAKAKRASEDSNRDDGNHRLQKKERDDDFDDKHATKIHHGETQLCNVKKGCLSKAADGGFCDGHSQKNNNDASSLCKSNDNTIDEGKAAEISGNDRNSSNKRPLLLEDADDDGEKKRGRKRPNVINLTDVPPQSPILRGRIKDGTSKYKGVYLHKATKKWHVTIRIQGTQHSIGLYENEEEAAIDYARAVFKYKSPMSADENLSCSAPKQSLPLLIKERQKSQKRPKMIDLTDVPLQPPILKRNGGKDGASKYQGVTFNKTMHKWQAQITIDGEQHYIGVYESEEEAAIDYARAAVKYRAGNPRRKAYQKRKQKLIDLTDVPPQPPIKSSRTSRSDSTSKYQGVYFNNASNQWQARITINRETLSIGNYESEEEAAIDYARALFKYKARKFIDLTDVPPKPPILRSGTIKDGASKYLGVTFHKSLTKWQAKITIDGEQHGIGVYDNEEEAAIDYARAVFKYDAGNAGGERRHKFIDLTDVPPQSPIKSNRSDGSSKYEGVTFNKATNKWRARISVDGKTHDIGRYDNEEEAAIDYARAAYKYKAGIAGGEGKQKFIDLTDVPPQSLIKSKRSGSSSKYEGVTFNKATNKWRAQIMIDGKSHSIGYYDNEEEAAIDYARAVFKYKTGIVGGERKQKFKGLADVPPQSPIMSNGSDSSSKHQGTAFDEARVISGGRIDGKQHLIGYYDYDD